MRRVDIQVVVEREGDRVVVQGSVGRGVVDSNWRMSKTGNHLLNVAYALHTGEWRAEGRVVPLNKTTKSEKVLETSTRVTHQK